MTAWIDLDREFLDFGDHFEQQFVHQESVRTLEQSMEIGWSLLQSLPVNELTRLSDAQIQKYVAGRST